MLDTFFQWQLAYDDADDNYRCDDMVKNFSVTYVPGGATQNTIRIAQVVNYHNCDNYSLYHPL